MLIFKSSALFRENNFFLYVLEKILALQKFLSFGYISLIKKTKKKCGGYNIYQLRFSFGISVIQAKDRHL